MPRLPERSVTPGFTVWFTGLSGAGKSTIARHVAREIVRRGREVEYLDGDAVRARLWTDLGFSREDRTRNVERIAWIAARLTRHGAATLVAAIAPYRDARRRARRLIAAQGVYLEIFVDASIETCARRDTKGLYARATAGKLLGLTGVDDPYEAPTRPDLIVRTEEEGPEASAHRVVELLESRGLLAVEETAAPRARLSSNGRQAPRSDGDGSRDVTGRRAAPKKSSRVRR